MPFTIASLFSPVPALVPAVVLILAAGPATAETAGLAAAPASDPVTELAADSWPERMEAAKACARELDEREVIERLEQAEGLPAEARHRLLELLHRRLLDRPRGALGIELRYTRPQGGQPGFVLVMRTHPGLPADGMLEQDDRILEIEGQPLDRDGRLADIIQERRPGDLVRLVVLRPRRDADGILVRDANSQVVEDRIELEIRLTSVDRLPDTGPGGAPDRVARERAQADWARIRERVSPEPHRVRFDPRTTPSWILVR